MGQNEQVAKVGAKHDQGKPRYSLLEWDFIKQIVYVLEFGAEKYTEEGWKQVPNAKQRYWDAAMRHLTAVKEGKLYDEDSGLPHYAHVAANCMFLSYFELRAAPSKEELELWKDVPPHLKYVAMNSGNGQYGQRCLS